MNELPTKIILILIKGMEINIKVGSNETGTAADTPPFLFSWTFGGRTHNYAGVSEPMSWYHAEVECNLR